MNCWESPAKGIWMTIREYSFELPAHLIAQSPVDKRGKDRLLVVDRNTQQLTDESMSNFVDYLECDSVLVVNNSKVRKARVFGHSETGGNVEFLFLEENTDHSWQAMVTKSKKQHVGKRYTFVNPDQTMVWKGCVVSENEDGTRTIGFDRPLDESFFNTLGHVPLPPYIKREDDFSDESRYQTVYAKNEGSVAAPTAGLHFTKEILDAIKAKGCTIAEVTLHVGPGTFLPVRTENLEDHRMHWERYEISDQSCTLINQALEQKRKIVAVGTTSIRTLESAFDARTNRLIAGEGRTNLFIKPGYKWKLVDQLLTNFHTPESTLLVLVSTFASKDLIFKAYHHAIDEEYRFFSYGDAMFIR